MRLILDSLFGEEHSGIASFIVLVCCWLIYFFVKHKYRKWKIYKRIKKEDAEPASLFPDRAPADIFPDPPPPEEKEP